MLHLAAKIIPCTYSPKLFTLIIKFAIEAHPNHQKEMINSKYRT